MRSRWRHVETPALLVSTDAIIFHFGNIIFSLVVCISAECLSCVCILQTTELEVFAGAQQVRQSHPAILSKLSTPLHHALPSRFALTFVPTEQALHQEARHAWSFPTISFFTTRPSWPLRSWLLKTIIITRIRVLAKRGLVELESRF